MDNVAMPIFWIFSLFIIYGKFPAGVQTTVPSVTDCVSPVFTNGIIQLSNSTSAGSVATFTCNEDFYISGTCEQNTTSRCLSSGNWSDPTPSCKSKGDNIWFNFSKHSFIEDSHDILVMTCFPTFDFVKATVNTIEIRRKLPDSSIWDTIATLNSSIIPTLNHSNDLAKKATITGIYSADDAKLQLNINESHLECEDVALYQCYITYRTDQGPCYGEISKQLNGFFFPKNISLEGKKNGVSFGPTSPNNPAQLKLGDTLDLNCTAKIGNNPNVTIAWKSSKSFTNGALLPGGPTTATYSNGTLGNYQNCQYTRSATMNHVIDTTDTSTGNISYSCYVHIQTPDGYTKDIEAENILHVEIYSTCPRPSPPAHGSIVITGTKINSEAIVSCEPGYLRSTGFATCGSSGKWDTVMRCNPVGCPKFPALTNGIITMSNVSNTTSAASFSCNSGYDLIGNSTATCNGKEWDALPPTCSAIECPNPEDPVNGFVLLDNGKAGVNDTITFYCYAGYTLVGSANTKCTLNATWQDSSPSCQVKYCEAPTNPQNGYVSAGTNYTVNSTVELFCNVGYNLTGNGTIQCTENATWSSSTAFCSLTECSLQPSLEHASIAISSSKTYVNDTATVVCDTGYILKGLSTVTCTNTGAWDTSAAHCIPKNCTFPLAPANGYIDSTTGLTVNSTAVISCNAGYNLTGNGTLQCKENATWSPMSVACNLLECEFPVYPENGYFGEITNYTVNSTAELFCNEGCNLTGNGSIQCTENATWSSSAAFCNLIECELPVYPVNGYVGEITNYTVNSTAELFCNDGYNLTGNGTIQCTENATWSSLAAFCNLIECSVLPSLAHASVNISSSKTYVNDTATVVCDPGYTLEGLPTVTCTNYGTWDTSVTLCVQKNCTYPLAPKYGYINSTTGLTVNSTAVISCNAGYNLTGNGTIECTENATWSPLTAACNLIECDFPIYPENGYIGEITNYTVNSTAELFCNDGYNLTGDRIIRCTENATWSSSAAFCELIECSFPPSLAHASVNISSSKTYVNDTATVVCDPGYTLEGLPTVTCTNYGTWDTSLTLCVPKNCTHPPVPMNGYISSRTGLTVNSIAVVSCKPGYNLKGNGTIQCTENATWSPLSAVCNLIECPVPSVLEHGNLNISNGQRYVSDTATIVCDPGYIFDGSPIVMCTEDGIWDIPLTTCIPRNCSMPEKPINGTVQVIDGFAVNSTAIITCNEGYDLMGERKIVCLENGLWSDTNGSCAIKECPIQLPLAHGRLNISASSIHVNSMASVVCDSGYTIDGSQIVVCTEDGTWDISLTTCIPRNCTLPEMPINGNVQAMEELTVNSTVIITCNEGYDLVGESEIFCLENGLWSDTKGECVIKDCGEWYYTVSSWTEYSYITYSPNTTFGSTAISFCRTGYQIINSTMQSLAATCTSNGTWSLKSPPLCVAVECPIIEASENITITYSNGKKNAVNSTATFKCDDPQSTINGYENVTCLSTGKWTGSSPNCIKIEKHTSPCPATRDYRGTWWKKTEPGKIVTGKCSKPESSLEYTGEISRQCTEKGQWNLPVYNCVRKDIDKIDKQIEAIKDNPSEEVVTEALDKLNEITTPTEKEKDGIFSGEIEKVTSILDSIADISLSAKTEVTNSQAEAFLSTTSNLLDTSNTESWKSVSQSQKEESGGEKTSHAAGAAKILDVVSRYSDAVTASLKNSSNSTTTVSVKNLVLHVTKVDKTSNGIKFPKSESNVYNLTSSFHLPQESLEGVKHVSSVLYKNLTGILSSRTTSNGTENQEINSAVVAVKIENWEQNTKKFHLTLTLGHFQEKFSDRHCSFWNENETAWDGTGCSLNNMNSSSSKSVCECKHLTNFAILMSPWEEENVDTKAIDIISTVGCSISLVALVLTIIAHIALWRYVKSDRVVILINLSIALVISYAIFLGGVDRTDNKDACTAVAALLQYIYLVVFFLMLAEGIEISVTVLYVFTTASRLKWLLPAAWLIPAVIVGISLGATQLQGYGNEQFCWLSVEGGLIWAFVAPAFTIILVNFVLLILILRAAFGASTLAQKSKTEKTKAGVKCLCVLLPLMGCTWVIGIFYVNKQMAWIQYVFAVCNSLQGLVIFLFHCAINKQIRMAIERRRKKYASSFLSTVSSTKRFSMPRASTTSSHTDRMEMSRSISRDESSFKSKNNFERNNSERNNYETISSRSRDSSLLQKRL